MDVLRDIDELSRVSNMCRLVYIATPSIKESYIHCVKLPFEFFCLMMWILRVVVSHDGCYFQSRGKEAEACRAQDWTGYG